MPKVDNSNITKRAENSYQVRIQNNAKTIRREFKGTLAEARMFRDKLRLEVASGLVSYDNIKFNSFKINSFIY